MDYNLDLLNKINEHYKELKKSFTKEDMKTLTGKDTFQSKMQGFLTFDYHRRDRLVKESEISYAYAFKEVHTKEDEDLVLTYVLHSPEKYFKEDANRYKDIAFKLGELNSLKKVKDKKLRTIHLCLTKHDVEAKYVEVPEPYNLNHLVFVSSVYLRKGTIPSFKLGVNLVFASLDISKEVLYVPFKYLIDEYVEEYIKHNYE